MLRVGLTYDLRSDYRAQGYSETETAEFDSELTIRALEEAILYNGYHSTRIGNARELCRRLVAGERWDLIFNIAEGVSGRSREAQVPGILEAFGIPYTFSDPLVCAVTLDKAVTKTLVRAAGLNTPDFAVVRSLEDVSAVSIPFPLFAKPLAEGTGKGITAHSRITSEDELRRVCQSLLETLREPILVEEFLPGREFTVGILGNGADTHVIGTMEIHSRHQSNGVIYSYEAKENWHHLITYTTPPPDALTDAVEALAVASYRALECRDAARVDIRLDASGVPSFMEVNPLPGLNPIHSDLPMLAYRAGIPYNELIGSIISAALARLD